MPWANTKSNSQFQALCGKTIDALSSVSCRLVFTSGFSVISSSIFYERWLLLMCLFSSLPHLWHGAISRGHRGDFSSHCGTIEILRAQMVWICACLLRDIESSSFVWFTRYFLRHKSYPHCASISAAFLWRHFKVLQPHTQIHYQ